MFNQKFMLRLGAMAIASVIGWVMMWSMSPAPDPAPTQAQQLIDSGAIYNMTPSDLTLFFGKPGEFNLHPDWDNEYELGDAGITTDPWLLVRVTEGRITEAQVVTH